MKCQNCKATIPKNSTFCNKCGSKVPESKGKAKRIVLLLCGIVILIILGLFVSALLPNNEILSVDIENDQVQYGQPLVFSVSYQNNSLSKMNKAIPIYMDKYLVLENVVELGGQEARQYDYTIEIANPGDYTLKIDDLSFPITALGPAEFSISMDESADLPLAGEVSEMAFVLYNTGPSAGEMDVTLVVDGETVFDEAVQIDADSHRIITHSFVPLTAGEFLTNINGQDILMTAYNASDLTTGDRMTQTKSSGPCYIDFTNSSEKDAVIYITAAEDTSTALLARYVSAGETYRIQSISETDIKIFMQLGNRWVKDINRFAIGYEAYEGTPYLDFKDNPEDDVDDYTYYTIEVFREEDGGFGEHWIWTDELPSLD